MLGSDLDGVEELGPYSHLHNGSMGALGARKKGSASTLATSYARADQKYNIAAATNTYMYNKNQREADDYLVG
jgi:hypothetical protein